MLDEGNVRLNEPWLRFVVPQSRARIERTDIIQRLLHRFDRPAKRFRNLFMLLELQRAQVLVDYRDCIVKQLCRGLAIAVFVQRELLLVIAQLIEQAFAKIAAANPRRIQLPDHFESFAQIGSIKFGTNAGGAEVADVVLASFFGIAAGSAIGAAGAGATAVAAMPAISAVTAACSHSEESPGDKSLSLIPCANSVSVPMPRAAASFTTLSTTVASASGGVGGAVPRSSSSLAMRYPSSLKFPMISSAASRTSGRTGNDPNCHMR